MDKPVVAGKSPIPVDLKKGETYYYCTCGKSDNQPFAMEHIRVLHLNH